MIKIEKESVFNLEGAIRGMRNPLNSWDFSDSRFEEGEEVLIGDKDLGLMKKLKTAGPSHRKFLRQILVCVDITAPLYW